eukprot:GAFH01002425.1.p2 GENE.GAFH01002425.1~~GAFH01002425.1.p2  ORF type:complete len:293 (-),score=64.34 GAFH01002425.1:300-1106(-)
MASPPGEFNEVLESCRTLVGDDTVLDPVVEEISHAYNVDQMNIVTLPTGEKGLITAYGEVSPNQYIIPKKSLLITYQHLQGTVTDTRPLAPEELSDKEPLRQAVEAAMNAYVAERYKDGVCEVYANQYEDGSSALVICLQATRINATSMWTGRWRSVWTITLSSANADCKGTFQVHTHCYEGGNVQLKSSSEVSATLEMAEPAPFAQALIALIRANEQKYHSQIDESFTRLGEDTFRALRFQLPISKQRVDWQTIAAQSKVGHELGRK